MLVPWPGSFICNLPWESVQDVVWTAQLVAIFAYTVMQTRMGMNRLEEDTLPDSISEARLSQCQRG